MSDSPHSVDPERVRTAQARLLDADETPRLAGLLADSARVRILYPLDLVDGLCVGDIALALEATRDSVGYVLPVQGAAGLVATREQRRAVFERRSDGFPEPLRQHWLWALVEHSCRVEQES